MQVTWLSQYLRTSNTHISANLASKESQVGKIEHYVERVKGTT